MKVNWKVRFKNKTWLASFFAAILTFVYTMLGLFDIYPEVTKNDVGEIINSVLMFLSLMGVIIDPTTYGLSDSLRAMGYDSPYIDHIDDFSDNGLVTELEDGTEEHHTNPEIMEDGTEEHVDPDESES